MKIKVALCWLPTLRPEGGAMKHVRAVLRPDVEWLNSYAVEVTRSHPNLGVAADTIEGRFKYGFSQWSCQKR